MIRDLNETGGAEDITCDVVVVGAGIAGLVLATRLARAGRRVAVLEAGGRHQEKETHPFNEVEQVGALYSGAQSGRFRCLGGTSTRWGGALIPFSRRDYEVVLNGADADWLGIGPELEAYIPEAERIFGLPPGPYTDEVVEALPTANGAFVPRSAKWPSFRQRNVAHLLAKDIESVRGPLVVLNAIADTFEFEPDGRLAAVTARTLTGRTLKVKAREFVLAAGAIETTRLLLLADRATNGRAFASNDVLGRYFQDHLSVPVLDFYDHKARRLNRLIGFRFQGRIMRNVRWEPDAALRREMHLPAAFAHVAFETSSEGFGLLRDVLRRIQRREPPSIGLLAELLYNSPWLWRAMWWRVAERRLLLPDDAALSFHVVVEQQPDRESRIALSSRLDPLGQPIALIDWRVNETDINHLHATARLLREAWQASAYQSMAKLKLREDFYAAGHGGIYHPTGSVRIGATRRDGPIDRDLRAHTVPNLTVASTAAFPTGGGANPTMSLVLATLRAADRLERVVS